MKRFRILSIILAAAVLFTLPAGVHSEEWTRYAMEGGVVNDIAFVTESGSEMVLCVCMANGLFYKNYNNGWTTQWNEELSTRLCCGVDAVSQGDSVMVLCSTNEKRVWMGAYSGGSWRWNSYACDITTDGYYPGEHYPGLYEDAAFYCEEGAYRYDHVFCILNDYAETRSYFNRSGIYFWNEMQCMWQFCRGAIGLSFSRFYRDRENPGCLYAIGKDGIYKFEGKYGVDSWTDIGDEFFREVKTSPVVDFFQGSQPPYQKYIVVESGDGFMILDDFGRVHEVSIRTIDLDAAKSALSETAK